ncbi:MAG TPA: COX15/CtaA family protein [Arthrobacter sp.]|nr:COX15/CtaA family protein [Arthrobacter sp.]
MTSPAVTRWTDRLPLSVGPGIHRLAIASLVTQAILIVSGGAVRLTGSGLGCSQWPNCMPGTMTPTPEMGIHGLIEFGNRLLTFVLAAVALAMIVAIWRVRRTHRSIFWLSVALLCFIPIQAVIGGITVLTDLNPWVVSLHFLASIALVAVATLLVNRTGRESRGEALVASGPLTGTLRALGWTVAVTSALALILGTVVTGTGPHAGDPSSPRHDFNLYLVTRIHVVPVYLLVIATLLGLYLVYRTRAAAALKRGYLFLVLAVLAQAAIGYTQFFLGLPIGVVLLHMVGTALLTATATNVWDRSTGVVPL